MSKINEIQNKLNELDGSVFQKLADFYLLKKIKSQYHQDITLTPRGSASGKNKTRTGTPDSLFKIGDKYIFAEYTTAAANIFNKFMEDLEKCLDTDKTGIPIDQIEEIIFCCNAELSSENINALKNYCPDITINFYGNDSIAFDLYEKYPQIAKEYLGVAIDTGQILSLDHFIARYEQGKFSTTLKTTFNFREEDKDNILDKLNNHELIILSGKAGVGKTRLAITCYEQFKKQYPAYRSYCIFNKNLFIYEDIQSYFSDSGSFLIFVDDANRISGFKHILDLLYEQREDQTFKIIVTVRDYALEEIRSQCEAFNHTEIIIKNFKDNEIEALIKTEYDINNEQYLERISDISKGNPRLAMMAGKLVIKEQSADSIVDITSLYTAYFSSIKNDKKELQNENMIKTAGLIAFFGHIDKENDNFFKKLESEFNLSEDSFWKAAKQLNAMEIADMFENDVVKISDQILGTYLIYLTFFEEKYLSLSTLFDSFFENNKNCFKDALLPILDFGYDHVKTFMEKEITTLWERSSNEQLYEIIDVFWFLKPNETLMHIKNSIDLLPTQKLTLADLNSVLELDDNINNVLQQTRLYSLIRILVKFNSFDKVKCSWSVQLLFTCLKKCPDNAKQVLSFLKSHYGYEYSENFSKPKIVIEQLSKYYDQGENIYFSEFFIIIAKHYIQTTFSITEMNKEYECNIKNYDLLKTQNHINFRKNLLNEIFTFYQKKGLKKQVLKFFLSYSRECDINNDELIKADSLYILDFFQHSLDPNNLSHCVVIQQYLQQLEYHHIPFNDALSTNFKPHCYDFYDLISDKIHEDKFDLQEELNKFTKDYDAENYQLLFEHFESLFLLFDSHEKARLQNMLRLVIYYLAEKNSKLYSIVIDNYLQKKDRLSLTTGAIVYQLIKINGAEETFKLLSKYDLSRKDFWFFSFYQHLPQCQITKQYSENLEQLYQIMPNLSTDSGIDYLLKYEKFQNGFVLKIIDIIVKRCKIEPNNKDFLVCFFENKKVHKQLLSLCQSNLDLLVDAYILAKKQNYFDSSGEIFIEFYNAIPHFLDKYITSVLSNGYSPRHQNLLFIWEKNNALEIMANISDVIIQKMQSTFHKYDSLFFKGVEQSNFNLGSEQIKSNKEAFLITEIKKYHQNSEYMKSLFYIIGNINNPQDKIKFYQQFLDFNLNIEDFKKLSFMPSSVGVTSSYGDFEFALLENGTEQDQKKKDLFNLIIEGLGGDLTFLEHHKYCEHTIKEINANIEQRKREYFTKQF